MLVLSRKKNETLMIGGGNSGLPLIKVIVVDIRGDKVRLGVEAPPHVPVHRQEVYEAILAAHGTASPTPRPDTTGATG